MSPQMRLPELIKGSYGFQNEKIKWSVSLHCFQFSLIPPKQEKGWDSCFEMIGVKIPSWIRNLIYPVFFLSVKPCTFHTATCTCMNMLAHTSFSTRSYSFPQGSVSRKSNIIGTESMCVWRICARLSLQKVKQPHIHMLAHTHTELCVNWSGGAGLTQSIREEESYCIRCSV